MSKVEELRIKYSNVSTVSFNKFVEGDKTKTKKYLEFLLRSWVKNRDQIKTTTLLIELVNAFDDLQPYIVNKDIYSKEYYDIQKFINTVEKAIDDREENTFNKAEHIFVLDENEDYLLLQPKTHKGSLKYGANTKWCTASKNNPETFNRYKKSGCLLYLLDKKRNKVPGYEKLAFYLENRNFLSGNIDIYNCLDNTVNDSNILQKGWTEDELIKIIMTIRLFASKWFTIKSSINELDRVENILKSLNFEKLKSCIDAVESFKEYGYISSARETVEKFINEIKNVKI